MIKFQICALLYLQSRKVISLYFYICLYSKFMRCTELLSSLRVFQELDYCSLLMCSSVFCFQLSIVYKLYIILGCKSS